MEYNHKPRQTTNFLLEELDGELMLYSLATTTIFALNHSAALIWQLCSGHYTIQEIVEALAAAYPGNRAVIGQQVEEILGLLLAYNAVELH